MAASPRGGSAEAERAILAHEKVFDLHGAKEWAQLFAGIIIVCVCGPPCGVVLFGAMLWEWLDRGFDGPFVNSGKELSGLLCARVAPYFNRVTQPFNERFVKKADDAYMMNSIVAFGGGVPLLFLLCAWNHVQRQREGLGLNYAAWLHMRLMKGLRGTMSAWWALVGLAVTTFAFLGVNMFLSGLHSYGTL